jgi:hypothetical protein
VNTGVCMTLPEMFMLLIFYPVAKILSESESKSSREWPVKMEVMRVFMRKLLVHLVDGARRKVHGRQAIAG